MWLAAVFSNLGLLAILVAAEDGSKLAFIYPLGTTSRPAPRRVHDAPHEHGVDLGTISSLYGLNAGIIDETQFSLLVTVVVLSAVVPTAIAERWFLPDAERERRVDRRLAYAESEEYAMARTASAGPHRRRDWLLGAGACGRSLTERAR